MTALASAAVIPSAVLDLHFAALARDDDRSRRNLEPHRPYGLPATLASSSRPRRARMTTTFPRLPTALPHARLLIALALASLTACHPGNQEAKQLDLACESGDLAACNRLASRLEKGEYILEDDARAATLFGRACDGAIGDACASLGVMNDRGTGVETRHDARRRAVSARMRAWRDGRLRAPRVARAARDADAARSGSCGDAVRAAPATADIAWAARGSARCHASGEGVPRDAARAAGLFRQSCDSLVAAGCLGLADAAPRGHRRAAPRLHGRRPPRASVRRAARVAACDRLGTLFEAGERVAQNYERASRLYRKACGDIEQGECLRAARADVRAWGGRPPRLQRGRRPDAQGVQARLHERVPQAEGPPDGYRTDSPRGRAPHEALRQRRRAQRRQLQHLRRHHRHSRRERRGQEHGDQDLPRPDPADRPAPRWCSGRTPRRASPCARGSATCRSTTACRAR